MAKLMLPYNGANLKTKKLFARYNNANAKIKSLYESNGAAWTKIFSGEIPWSTTLAYYPYEAGSMHPHLTETAVYSTVMDSCNSLGTDQYRGVIYNTVFEVPILCGSFDWSIHQTYGVGDYDIRCFDESGVILGITGYGGLTDGMDRSGSKVLQTTSPVKQISVSHYTYYNAMQYCITNLIMHPVAGGSIVMCPSGSYQP